MLTTAVAGRGSPAGPRPPSTHMQGDGQGAAGETGAGGHPHTVQTWGVPNYDQILSLCFLRVLTTREAFWTCKTKHCSSSRDAESPVFTHSDLALDLLTGARRRHYLGAEGHELATCYAAAGKGRPGRGPAAEAPAPRLCWSQWRPLPAAWRRLPAVRGESEARGPSGSRGGAGRRLHAPSAGEKALLRSRRVSPNLGQAPPESS